MLTSFIIAVQFLTRIPVSFLLDNKNDIYTKNNLSRSLKYYPLIGLIIGVVLVVIAFVLQSFSQDHILYMAGIIVALWVYITGGLHLDGVADMADAWVGGLGDKKRTLEIMKDPVCGPFAVIAIVLVILLKFILVYELIQYNPYLLIAPPLLSRCFVVLLLMTTPYARKDGMGADLNATTEKDKNIVSLFVFSIAGGLVLSLWADSKIIAGVYFIAFIFLYLFRRNIIKRVSGLTGDLAGAFIEYTEVLVLFSLVNFLMISASV